MPSETDVLNVALGTIGAQRVTSIDDGTAQANACKTFYPPLLDSLLRLTHWNFAGGRAALALLPDAPLFEYTYAYALPSDFIKLRRYHDNISAAVWDINDFNMQRYVEQFRIETYVPSGAPPDSPPVKIIVSNGSAPMIEYTRRVTNPDLWDAGFFQVISKWLASELAEALARDSRRATSLKAEAISLLSLASAIDGQEQSNEPFQVDNLLWGR